MYEGISENIMKEIDIKVRKRRMSSRQRTRCGCIDHARPGVGGLDFDFDPWRLVGGER